MSRVGDPGERFERLSAGLADAVRRTDGLTGLALLGSASEAGAPRRDEWSDHDFFAIIETGAGPRLREDLSWLPEHERIVLIAREGEIGFAALYDDGHVFEFAYSEVGELSGAVAGDASVVVDDPDDSTAALIARARARAEEKDVFDPANDARLVLVKLLIGVGRVRRGEVIVGGWMVRTWAVQHLVRAIRGRYAGHSTSPGDPRGRDAIDPARRFERDFPEWGARIGELLERPVEQAARGLFDLLREVLEPDWPEFPSAAANALARRVGWD